MTDAGLLTGHARRPPSGKKIERFHRSLRTEFLTGRRFASLYSAQGELDE